MIKQNLNYQPKQKNLNREKLYIINMVLYYYNMVLYYYVQRST